MNKTVLQYNEIKSRLKPFLIDYLASQGIQVTKGKNFRCIAHTDTNPSCSIVPESHGQTFHCFSCGASGDIFTAAYLLEGKPIDGRAFLKDNVAYLAQRFGVECPEVELTPDEQAELETYSAYRDALRILLFSSEHSERVKLALTVYGWTKDTRQALGIGSVTSYDDYMSRMTKVHGWSLVKLKEFDLDRKGLFNENNLIYTVRDEHGNPVGFAARNLRYEEQKQAYDQAKAKIIAEKGDTAEELKALFIPRKYNNSIDIREDADNTVRNRIYQKSKRLFGLHQAKKFVPPLWIFEGYSDCATAYDRGMKNVCSIGSISFSTEHLDLILSLGIKHLIFVLDADRAGEVGTERFVKLLDQHIGGHVGLRVEIVVMPEGSDDPDAFIRKYGLSNFKQLTKVDSFSWRLTQAVKNGEDIQTLCDRVIAQIVNEPNNLIRARMAKQLAEATKTGQDVIWREVVRLVDADVAKLEEEKMVVARQTSMELARNPMMAETILKEGMGKIEVLTKRKSGYDNENVIRYMDLVLDKIENDTHKEELITGWPLFDEKVGGIPSGEAFITVPGKMNQGKTSLFSNLIWRLLDYNKNCMCLFHSVDDAMERALPRIMSCRAEWGLRQNPTIINEKPYRVWTEKFRKAGYWRASEGAFAPYYQEQKAWVKEMLESERLVLADISSLPASLPALEGWVHTLRQRFPDRKLVVLGDNFHLFDLPGYPSGEDKIRHMSMFIKRLANEYHSTQIFTMELPKDSLRPGVRPRARNMKGSGGMAFDSNLNMGVYNDLKDFEFDAKVFWEDDHEQEYICGQTSSVRAKRKPVVELVFDKSKINSYDGQIFYKFDWDSGVMMEGTKTEQEDWLNLSRESQHLDMAGAFADNKDTHFQPTK